MSKSLNVLMFGWELPPENTGGLGIACQGLANGLVNLGIDLSFILPRPLNTTASYIKLIHPNMPGVQVTAINSHLQSYSQSTNILSHYSRSHSHLHPNFPSHMSHSMYDEAIRYAKIANSIACCTPHHLIHAHDWMTYPAAMISSKSSGKSWIAHVHATEFDRSGDNVNQHIAETEYQGLNDAKSVIAVSNYTKDIIHDKYKVPKTKIHVVHNGVNLQEFSPIDIRTIFPNDKIVLYVGRLTFQKGVEYLISAAKEVLLSHPDTVFIIVGEGDMYQQHILETASLGVSNRIIFTGFLRGEKLKTIYQMSDVLVMPSISEPYGLVALEAISSNIPVIISKQSGVSETITHAHTVDFWDTYQIAEKIRLIFDYPQLSQEMVALARSEASRLTWDRAAQKTLNIYHHHA